jgi:protein involved in polysaccharide export with SLBB domain
MLRITVTAFALTCVVIVGGCASTRPSVVAISSAQPLIDTTPTASIPTAAPGELYRVYPGDEINGTPVQGDPPIN